ncbi:MAG: DNA gyrase subunit A [Candidatus Shikimatogenerans sp. Tmey]
MNKIIDINTILKKSYLDYSMSVIISRAIPDIRDGLKPVHRRILYSMYKLHLFYNKKFKKSARIVGEVLGKYHPHGDISVYNAIVRMVQKWTLRYPLLIGQGNFGSIESDSAAAMRYTEIKLSKITKEIPFIKIKNIIKMKNNFDNSLKEPIYLPINFPNLLINGSYGIAVGMATNMVPHNLSEIIKTICLYIKNPHIKKKKLFKYIKGPDFPTGGIIIYNDYKYLYKGKGKITLIAKYKINYKKYIIIIEEIPYQISKLNILDQIKKNIKYKKILGISKIIDKTDRKGIKILFYIKKKYKIDICLNQLFKYSQLKINIYINNLILVKNKPEILNFKKIIYYFVKNQHKLYIKDIIYKYKFYKNKLLLLNNILIIINNIKNILKLFKKSSSKKVLVNKLLSKYKLSKKIIDNILKIKLYRFSQYEIKKIYIKKKYILNKIKKFKIILSSKKIRMIKIYKNLKKIKKKYSDKRKTKIIKKLFKINKYNKYIHNIKIILIFYSKYIFKTLFNIKKSKYFKKIKNHKIYNIIIINNNKYLLCFTKKGYYFWININNINYNKKYCLLNIFKLKKNDKIISIIKINNINKYKYLLIITKYGFINKIKFNKILNFNKKNIKNIFFNKKDYIIKCSLIKNKNIYISYLINNYIIVKNINIKKNKINIKNIKLIKKINKKNITLINIKKYILLLIIYENGFLKIYKIKKKKKIKINNFYKKKIIFFKKINNQKNIILINNLNKIYKFKLKNLIFNNNYEKKLKIKNKITNVTLY